ncbi:MAG: hypothetical protein ACREIT_08575, partial [Tepidisphaeraceae bacterium]
LREEARDADEDALARQPDDVASLHRTLSGDTHAPDALGAPVGVPSTRFWLLTSLLALFTATGGAYVLATSVHTWNPSELWEYVTSLDMPRRLSHVGVGGGIVLTSLILAGLSRWAPRSTLSLALFSTLLIALIAAQVWVGVLMMYDTAQGSVTGFNPDVGTPTPRVASTTAPTTTTAPVAP